VAENARIRVLIADDHSAVRNALASLVQSEAGLELAGAAANAAEAIDLAAREQPDVALLDVQMPMGGGAAAAHGIAACSPRTRMIVYSATTRIPDIDEPAVVAFLPKGSRINDIVGAVKTAAQSCPRPGSNDESAETHMHPGC
jgi:DNA-binding NarL/FixJ family response regulator